MFTFLQSGAQPSVACSLRDGNVSDRCFCEHSSLDSGELATAHCGQLVALCSPEQLYSARKDNRDLSRHWDCEVTRCKGRLSSDCGGSRVGEEL